ncbi:paraquat-inducible protein A [Marinobacterium arenosum]|uniref:paraquat-inducible protein A n=1 Tax=Marinobacterium arenosum TaxID=2862496 RepID=UPI001C945F64|nr:paraquat-inducible protein A [Marinobacterium arenosum]MBY4675314.1 paraquat-inducible protein A [Marinobacterium arenosum]
MDQPVSDQLTACHSCDYLLRLPELQPGQKAQCPRCGHPISRRVRHALDRSLAFAVSALLFLTLALMFPFLAFKVQGRMQEMSLLHSAVELIQQDYLLLAALLLLFILLAPTALLALLLPVLLAVRRGRSGDWTFRFAHLLFAVQPWSMVEVFMIGVLVSLVKLSSQADVVLGLSFWAYILFSLSLTAAFAGIDRYQLWHALDEAHHG